MGGALFLVGTGTSVGKTYVAGLLAKEFLEKRISHGYYKAVLSGLAEEGLSDEAYVACQGGLVLGQDTKVSFSYDEGVSPHLAAKKEGNPPNLEVIAKEFSKIKETHLFTTIEGSGGIVCPLREIDGEFLLLEQVVVGLGVSAVIVAPSGLGSINATVLTAFYMKEKKIPVKGIILNEYRGNEMEEDNKKTIEKLTGLPVIATIAPSANHICWQGEGLVFWYQ